MNYRADALKARLLRAGVPSGTVDTLVPGDVTGARTALESFVTRYADAVIYAAYTGGTPPAPGQPDPYPQYLTEDDLAALAYLADTITVDARQHGATGDGVTLDRLAIQNTLDGLPEGAELLLRPGTYLIDAPLILRRNRGIRGLHSGLWPYDTGGPVRIKASAAFAGEALVRMQDEHELYGSVGAPASGLYVGPNDQSGMWLTRLTLDGFDVAGGIDGVKASGLVRSVRLTDVSVRRCTGSGFHTVSYARPGPSTVYPRGWRLDRCVADSCGANGFALNLTNDTTLTDCLAVNNTSHGFYLAGPGELILNACRAAWNKARGFMLTGTCYGNALLAACTTDRNEQSGIYADTTGRHPILISGCTLRRDGRNGNGGGGSYAGLLVSAATTPIVVSGLTTETGQDDDATGTMSPQYGLRVLNSTSVVVDSGVLGGNTAPTLDGGGNTHLRISPSVVLMTGSINAPTLAYAPDSAPFPQPVDHALAAWSFDPALAINTASTVLTSGVEFQVKLRLTAPTTLGSVLLAITAGGSGLVAGQSLVGIRSAAGVLIGLSADQSASFASAGVKTVAVAPTSAGSLTMLPPGIYYAVVLCVGTTMPTFLRAASQTVVNAGLAAGAFRFATLGSGLTALPAAPSLAGQAANSTALWVAAA